MGDRARAKWAKKWGLLCPFPWGGGAGMKLKKQNELTLQRAEVSTLKCQLVLFLY